MTRYRRLSRTSRSLSGLTLAARSALSALGALSMGGCSIENPDFLGDGDDGASDNAETTVDSGVTAEDGTGSADAGDGDGDGDSNSSSSSSGDGDGDCAPDAECRAVPDGWVGFFTVAELQDFDLDAPPGCSEPNWDFTKYNLLADPVDADCACECDPLLDESKGPPCDDAESPVLLAAYADEATCLSTDGPSLFEAALDPEVCTPVNVSDISLVPGELSAIFDAGSPPLAWDCRANDEVEFGQAALMCASTNNIACDTGSETQGQCVAPPETADFMGRVCVYKTGASQECPEGYANPVVTDLFPSGQLEGQDPSCTECGCEGNEPEAPVWCQVEAVLYADGQCADSSEFATGTCNEGDTCEIMEGVPGATPITGGGAIGIIPLVSPPADADVGAATCGLTVGGDTLQEGVPFGFNGEPITVCCDQP